MLLYLPLLIICITSEIGERFLWALGRYGEFVVGFYLEFWRRVMYLHLVSEVDHESVFHGRGREPFPLLGYLQSWYFVLLQHRQEAPVSVWSGSEYKIGLRAWWITVEVCSNRSSRVVNVCLFGYGIRLQIQTCWYELQQLCTELENWAAILVDYFPSIEKIPN